MSRDLKVCKKVFLLYSVLVLSRYECLPEPYIIYNGLQNFIFSEGKISRFGRNESCPYWPLFPGGYMNDYSPFFHDLSCANRKNDNTYNGNHGNRDNFPEIGPF